MVVEPTGRALSVVGTSEKKSKGGYRILERCGGSG